MKAQGVDRNTLVFRSPFQPYTAWATFFFFVLVILFNGFKPFTQTKGGWGSDQLTDFFTAYTGVGVFFLLYIVWKVLKRDPLVKPAAADIWTGKAGELWSLWSDLTFTDEMQLLMRRSGLSRFPVISLRSSGSGCARSRVWSFAYGRVPRCAGGRVVMTGRMMYMAELHRCYRTFEPAT